MSIINRVIPAAQRFIYSGSSRWASSSKLNTQIKVQSIGNGQVKKVTLLGSVSDAIRTGSI